MQVTAMFAHFLSTLLRRQRRAIIPLLVASTVAHAETLKLPVDTLWVTQSAQQPATSGTDDAKELAVKLQVYDTFLWDLGADSDARCTGKPGPFIDWQRVNHLGIQITDQQWDIAYQIFLDAWDRMAGRVPLVDTGSNDPAGQSDPRKEAPPGQAHGNTTLPSSLEIYKYTVQRLKDQLGEEAFRRLDSFIDEYGHGYALRHSPPTSEAK
jgi:hypothetical protein